MDVIFYSYDGDIAIPSSKIVYLELDKHTEDDQEYGTAPPKTIFSIVAVLINGQRIDLSRFETRTDAAAKFWRLSQKLVGN